MTWELDDPLEDPGETTDLARQKPEAVSSMVDYLIRWRASCANRDAGNDDQPIRDLFARAGDHSQLQSSGPGKSAGSLPCHCHLP